MENQLVTGARMRPRKGQWGLRGRQWDSLAPVLDYLGHEPTKPKNPLPSPARLSDLGAGSQLPKPGNQVTAGGGVARMWCQNDAQHKFTKQAKKTQSHGRDPDLVILEPRGTWVSSDIS